MKLSKIAIAIAALSAGSAFAAPPPASQIAFSSGASAPTAVLLAALDNLCPGPTMTRFTSGNNIQTVVCTTGTAVTGADYQNPGVTPAYATFAGTPYVEFRLNVAGGSFTAVQVLNGACDQYAIPGAPVTLTACPGTPPGVRIGGLLDVEPEAFSESVIGSLTAQTGNAGVAQTFGVAASNALYDAMYLSQRNGAGGATVELPIPSSCPAAAPGDTSRLECIPTISKGQFASIINNNEFGSAKTRGANFLASTLPSGTLLRYARRVDTSGTQASANIYFLGSPCSRAQLAIIDAPTTAPVAPEVLPSRDVGALRVLAAPGTGDVRTALNVNAAGRQYTIGVMSGENNQATQLWKWLRVQGAAIGENATPATAGITNNATARNGQYDFYFETKYAFLNGTQEAFWIEVSNALGAVTPPVGLLQAADLLGYNKGGQACLPNSSN